MRKNLMKKTAAVLSALTALSAMPCTAASAAENNLFPYAMFAASDAEGAITINSNWLTMNGSIASNGTIVTNGYANFNGAKTENAGEDMLFIGDKVTDTYFSNAETVDYLDISDVNVFIGSPVDVAGDAVLNGNVNIASSIKADYDITITGNVNNTSNAVIFSEFGDIVIDSDNVNFSGILYAPLGNVEITGSNVNLNNAVIIADTITINSYNTNANYGYSYAKFAGTESESRAEYIKKYNTSLMEKTISTTLDTFSQYYTLTPVDTGDFSHVNIMNMIEFDIQQYDVEGIGNLSIMKAEGMAQMTTYVLSPYDKDLPLLSVDYMYNGDQRVSYVEYYDLTADKYSDEYQGLLNSFSGLYDTYQGLADTQPSAAWYDDLRTVGLFKTSDFRADDITSQMLFDSIQLTLEGAQNLHDLNAEEKAIKFDLVQGYADNLIDMGGIATNMFKMAMGADATREFFNSVFFGTYRNQPAE